MERREKGMNMRVVAVNGLPTPQGLRAGHVLLISRFGVRVPGGELDAAQGVTGTVTYCVGGRFHFVGTA